MTATRARLRVATISASLVASYPVVLTLALGFELLFGRPGVLELCAAGHAAAPHISCIGSSRTSIREILTEYKSHGIRHLVALRGCRVERRE